MFHRPILLVFCLASLACGQDKSARKGAPPSQADLPYGSYPRQVFDFWQAGDGSTPLPVYIHFHGGGFVAGDKASLNPDGVLSQQIHVVSGNYRFADGETHLVDACLRDGARLVQYLRANAEQFGIDPQRIAMGGGSAGAVISLWVGYHDDLADPDNKDPVLRESSRLNCILPMNGPTSMVPDWVRQHIGGSPSVHEVLPIIYGIEDPLAPLPAEKLALAEEASAFTHLTADDPPTLLIYNGELSETPLPEKTSTAISIHHPRFGELLAEELARLEIPHGFHHRDARADGSTIGGFLQQHLK